MPGNRAIRLEGGVSNGGMLDREAILYEPDCTKLAKMRQWRPSQTQGTPHLLQHRHFTHWPAQCCHSVPRVV